MGIKGLSKLIEDVAPRAITRRDIKYYCGKRVAIDASVLLYQFLTTIQDSNGNPLTNSSGEPTSHLVGLLARLQHMLEAGIKPIFVFDGAPPEEKGGELDRRRDLKEQAEEEREKALAEGNMERARMLTKRMVRVTQKQVEQAYTLLKHLGIPAIIAGGEAEAQCVALVRAGKCDAVASTDMDTLALGTPILLRNLASSKDPTVIEYSMSIVLEDTGLTQEEFIDLCILCGCDYLEVLGGIGPKTAYKLIGKYRTLEAIIQNDAKVQEQVRLQEGRWEFTRARALFTKPSVIDPETLDKDLIWRPIDSEKTIAFLVDDMQFSLDSVKERVQKLQKARRNPKQTTIDQFVKRKTKP
ncbi:Flap structure-specific endonuclease [Giardia muris]|uniref:Flap endonuclease 1 n=1 Tax=Giardia muris TaxID=5742 RepID=A0A4Z1T8D1_GIAMU|nr:Flap structure-specific endonuclease [Giardia muris]|eukprot:TNJ28849.1 Flap structure-specific endonuclease [Giardia muris]